jgi:gliding motility-associated-like protein
VVKPVNIYPIPLTDAGHDTLVCRDNFVQLNATGATSYVWDASSSLSCTDCASPLAAPADSTRYFVTGSTSFGCTARDSVIVKVRQHFKVAVSPGENICVGSFVQLTATGADQYQWSPSAGLNNAGIASPIASPAVSTLYTVIAIDNDHCFADTASININVSPIPTVAAGVDITLGVGSSVQLQAAGSADVISWVWTPGSNLSCVTCPNPVASPKQTTQYSVEVMNSGGCKSSDALTVFVVCIKGNLFIPNTFSPNGDGINDMFYPRGTGVYLIKSLRIYNRWGEIVFEKLNFNVNDASAGWNGLYKGQKLSPDVFVYTCEVVCENNEVLLSTGDVTLIR